MGASKLNVMELKGALIQKKLSWRWRELLLIRVRVDNVGISRGIVPTRGAKREVCGIYESCRNGSDFVQARTGDLQCVRLT